MTLSILGPLGALTDVSFQPGVDYRLLEALEEETGLRLPDDHKATLRESNGLRAYGGYIKIFGIGKNRKGYLENWNDYECWKFSWEHRCDSYYSFAETAWGDQYAYKMTDGLLSDYKVYILDCLSMTPTQVAADFSEFLVGEFFRTANNPYDIMIKKARQKLGNLEDGDHIIYLPSPLIGGVEDISYVRKMNARSAMICNGDIAVQLDNGPQDKNVEGVVAYEDEAGRSRIKLTWS